MKSSMNVISVRILKENFRFFGGEKNDFTYPVELLINWLCFFQCRPEVWPIVTIEINGNTLSCQFLQSVNQDCTAVRGKDGKADTTQINTIIFGKLTQDFIAVRVLKTFFCGGGTTPVMENSFSLVIKLDVIKAWHFTLLP